MRDGFLASMVTQYKRNQSRASGSLSRPSSSLSHISPVCGFTPIRMLSQEINSSFEQSCSERSTPSANRLLIAKCQACNIRGELIICLHCDNVICVKCADGHQSVISSDVKQEWNICKDKFEAFNERSSRFFEDDEILIKIEFRSFRH
jgi:hypothetical protein